MNEGRNQTLSSDEPLRHRINVTAPASSLFLTPFPISRASALGGIEASPNKLGFLSDEPTGELGQCRMAMFFRSPPNFPSSGTSPLRWLSHSVARYDSSECVSSGYSIAGHDDDASSPPTGLPGRSASLVANVKTKPYVFAPGQLVWPGRKFGH